MYQKTVLNNGVRVITHQVKGSNSISLGFWIGVGGRYEEGRLKGVAHFLEHIVFKGSHSYSGEEIKMKIEGVGGALNAFTSEEQTCFYAKIPSKHLNQTFNVLADMVLCPTITSKDVSKEKTVIVEEIKMYNDLPQYYVQEILEGLLWPNHPLGESLAGTQETVMGTFAKDLKGFHETFYAPGNIVVAACGNLSHDKILKLVRKQFKALKASEKKTYVPVEAEQSKPNVKFSHRNIEQMHLALGLPAFDENHKDRYALNLLSIILGGNMSSRLFVEVREKKGLAYSISSSYKTLHDSGLFLIRAGVDNQKIVPTVKVILKEFNKIKREGVDQGEFKRAREYLMGQLLLGLEDTMDHMLWIGESIVARNKVRTLKNVLKEFEKVSVGDVKRVACEIFNPKKYNLAIVGPVTDQQQKELKMLMRI